MLKWGAQKRAGCLQCPLDVRPPSTCSLAAICRGRPGPRPRGASMLLILPVGQSPLRPPPTGSDMETHLPEVPQFVHGRNEDMNPVSLAPESYFGHRLAPPIPYSGPQSMDICCPHPPPPTPPTALVWVFVPHGRRLFLLTLTQDRPSYEPLRALGHWPTGSLCKDLICGGQAPH